MRVSDLFGGGTTGRMMQGRYDTNPVHAWFQNRHAKQARTLVDSEGFYRTTTANSKGKVRDHSWKVPYGIRYALRVPLIHCQIVNRYPWAVTWKSPKTGHRLRKRCSSLAHAIDFIATRAQYVDPKASIISRQRHYDIPPRLRGKIPLPFKWCPRCLAARRFKRVYTSRGDPETFSALRKEWDEVKGRFEWKERILAITRCNHCGTTNRNAVMRRSNQPWEIRKFKRGVTRARKQKRR